VAIKILVFLYFLLMVFLLSFYVKTFKKLLKPYFNSSTSLPHMLCGISYMLLNNKGFLIEDIPMC